MRRTLSVFALVSIVAVAGSAQTPTPELPLGQGRPDTPGITRTTLKDDAKVTVTRVRFEPGASEPLHTHPYDIVLVPVMTGPVNWTVADRHVSRLSAGEVQFVPRDVPHQLKNAGGELYEIIAIAAK